MTWMSVYLRARSKLDLVSNQGCSFLPCVQDKKKMWKKKQRQKTPSSLQLCNTVRESVFSVWIQAQLCMRRCLVAWLKKKEKKRIKHVTILCISSCFFLTSAFRDETKTYGVKRAEKNVSFCSINLNFCALHLL